MRETRPRLPAFVEQRMEVALWLGSPPPLPGLRDESKLPVVDLREASKVYARGGGSVVALDGVSVAIEEGEKIAIMGPSSAG